MVNLYRDGIDPEQIANWTSDRAQPAVGNLISDIRSVIIGSAQVQLIVPAVDRDNSYAEVLL